MFSFAVLLFVIMDPIGNMITLNALLADYSARERSLIILREGVIATGILLLAAFFGGAINHAIGLHEHALLLGGGIVLFLIALGMVFPSRSVLDEQTVTSPLIVPIAMPLIAGPSSISMVIIFSEKYTLLSVCSAVLMASMASTALLTCSSYLYALLGRRGATALERLMGMLLIMISVQMIMDGIDLYLDVRALPDGGGLLSPENLSNGD